MDQQQIENSALNILISINETKKFVQQINRFETDMLQEDDEDTYGHLKGKRNKIYHNLVEVLDAAKQDSLVLAQAITGPETAEKLSAQLAAAVNGLNREVSTLIKMQPQIEVKHQLDIAPIEENLSTLLSFVKADDLVRLSTQVSPKTQQAPVEDIKI